MNSSLNNFLFFLVFLTPISNQLIGQCIGFPNTIPSSDCKGHAPLISGANINSGQTFSICSTSNNTGNYNNINLNGGLIKVCGNATLTGNFNSGTIIVECGATLFCPSGLLLNSNVGIINYGTVEVTGDLNFQNSNVYFYNESSTSRLFVSGNLLTATNTNQTNYIKNRGYISVQNTLFAREGSFFCLSSNSIIDCDNFVYMQNCGGPANRFTKEDIGADACLRYETSASLRSTVTSNSSIKIAQASGSSANFNGCGSFGSATLSSNAASISAPSADNCSQINCFTLLPVKLIDFKVKSHKNKNATINWSTSSEENNKEFQLLRSVDGITWEIIAVIFPYNGNLDIHHYNFTDYEVPAEVVYYRLKQVDLNGEYTYSPIKSITTPIQEEHAFLVYPNPATTTLHLKNNQQAIHSIQIINLQGQIISEYNNLNKQQTTLSINTATLPKGMYLIKTNLNSRIFSKY